MIHKPSIVQPENFQQEAHKLYRWATRLLLERISWLCRANGRTGDCEADLVFSNRSAMSYEDLRDYLNLLLRNHSMGSEVSINWDVISSQRVRAVNHDQLAGLQIADAVATSAYYAANRNPYSEVEERYLRIIGNTVYRYKERVDGYGIKVWCDSEDERKRLADLASP